MEEFKNRYLRPGRKVTDQFLLASVITFAILAIAELFLPIGSLLLGTFERLLGGDHDAAVFLETYFSFISIWIGMFLVVLIFKINRPMLHAVKYCGSKDRGLNGNPAGNNGWGLLIGLALGFGTNGICILLSALLGDIHLSYSGFKLIPFLVFFISVFIQSAAEELANRWYLYQKLRRRYKSPWFAIIVNSLLFMAMHLANPGITFLSLVQLILVAVLLSLIVYYYNGLWIAMAFHAGWNFTQSIFFGLPNSGIVSAYSVFRLDAASATNGPFYNVNFGVEGSVGAGVILAVIIVIVILLNRGKTEHTDVWADADREAVEKAAAKEAAVKARMEEMRQTRNAEDEKREAQRSEAQRSEVLKSEER